MVLEEFSHVGEAAPGERTPLVSDQRGQRGQTDGYFAGEEDSQAHSRRDGESGYRLSCSKMKFLQDPRQLHNQIGLILVRRPA